MIFGCMLLNIALLLMIRSFSAAMLMLAKKRYFVAYMVGDMALYLLQKVERGDFHYWLPLDGALGLLRSLLLRMGVKTITDFTDEAKIASSRTTRSCGERFGAR